MPPQSEVTQTQQPPVQPLPVPHPHAQAMQQPPQVMQPPAVPVQPVADIGKETNTHQIAPGVQSTHVAHADQGYIQKPVSPETPTEELSASQAAFLESMDEATRKEFHAERLKTVGKPVVNDPMKLRKFNLTDNEEEQFGDGDKDSNSWR